MYMNIEAVKFGEATRKVLNITWVMSRIVCNSKCTKNIYRKKCVNTAFEKMSRNSPDPAMWWTTEGQDLGADYSFLFCEDEEQKLTTMLTTQSLYPLSSHSSVLG